MILEDHDGDERDLLQPKLKVRVGGGCCAGDTATTQNAPTGSDSFLKDGCDALLLQDVCVQRQQPGAADEDPAAGGDQQVSESSGGRARTLRTLLLLVPQEVN